MICAPLIGGVADPFGDVGHAAEALLVQDLDRHERSAEREPGCAHPVVRRLGDGPGDVRAVALVVVRLGRVVHEVPPALAACPREIGPAREGPLVEAGDAGVDHGDRDALSAGVAPRLLRADPAQVPLLARVERVVRDERLPVHRHGFGVLHARVARHRVDDGVLAGRIDVGDFELVVRAAPRAVRTHRDAVLRTDRLDLRRARVVADVDGNLALDTVADGVVGRAPEGRHAARVGPGLQGGHRHGQRGAGDEEGLRAISHGFYFP